LVSPSNYTKTCRGWTQGQKVPEYASQYHQYSLAYPNLLGTKGYVVVVVAVAFKAYLVGE
jgi:hypothetical protein